VPVVTAIPLGRASLHGSVPPTRQLVRDHTSRRTRSLPRRSRWPIWCCCA